MGDLSNHLSRSELACKCKCGFDAADTILVQTLELVMDHFEEIKGRRLALHINSGNRCRPYNTGIPGSSDASKHIQGIACDFWVEDVHADDVADYLEEKYPSTFGIGRYDGRTHLDVRLPKARWDMRS